MTAGASSVKGLASAVLLLFCSRALINAFLTERNTELHVVLVSARTMNLDEYHCTDTNVVPVISILSSYEVELYI